MSSSSTYHPSQIAATIAQLEGESPYRLLNVTEAATEADIKKRFRVLAMDLHPDRTVQHSDLEREKLNAKFSRVKLAYDVLSDRSLRAAYDAHALMGRSSFRPPAGSASGVPFGGAGPVYGGGGGFRPQPGPSFHSNFNPDGNYGDFSYAGYRPATSPAALRFRNGWIAFGVVGFALFGASVQYWRYQRGSALIRATIESNNAHNVQVLAGVRERAKGRTRETFHSELAEHIELNRELRKSRFRHEIRRPAYEKPLDREQPAVPTGGPSGAVAAALAAESPTANP
ncbi:hypothetical protein BCR44DRAFT_35998 [Catenaria anguillulae PL171]|uniref:J domain-containing protein n=1 Tax=Catenaria anguillulae PL171 TaxID=765915 RepID=A0A1Y2I0A2_9FUNG|nr:hypothetical protein BCR44DRAFT_35998 [Catenaria anguillulae PL171]